MTPEERTWKEKAAEFADTVLRKHLREYDERNCFPEKIHEAAHDAGLMNIAIPKEFGGHGVSQKIIAVAGEELATVCSPSAFTMGFNHGSLQPILVAGTEAQKNIFVKDLLDRRGYASICLSEPDSAGSNLMAIRTRADRTADGWRITGEKCMVGNGCRSELFLVLADTFVDGRRSGLSFFAVPRGEGVTVSPNTDKIGFRCLTTPSISFREVGVPDDHRIGEVGGAEEILLQTLDYIRFGGTPVILGITVGALRDIVPFLETRKVFPDEPLIQKSHIQLQLGDLYSEVRNNPRDALAGGRPSRRGKALFHRDGDLETERLPPRRPRDERNRANVRLVRHRQRLPGPEEGPGRARHHDLRGNHGDPAVEPFPGPARFARQGWMALTW